MIRSIEFKDPTGVELPPSVMANYAFSLPSLNGRTFEFKPGLNIVIGKNGSGKSSLLNVIRALTFCDKQFMSTAAHGRAYWELHLLNQYECGGYWHLAELKADYRYCTVNLRKNTDMGSTDFEDSMMNFVQTMHGFRQSDCQTTLEAINMMVRYFKYGEDWNKKKENIEEKKKDELGLFPHQNFRTMVISPIEDKLKECNETYRKATSDILEYYKRNHEEGLKGFTFLMDEPDKGMDVYNVQQVFELLSGNTGVWQDIVVLHNIGLIHKLKGLGDKVNFIELTDGYLSGVERFFGGEV